MNPTHFNQPQQNGSHDMNLPPNQSSHATSRLGRPPSSNPLKPVSSFSRPAGLRSGPPTFAAKKQESSKTDASKAIETGIDDLFSKPPPRVTPARVPLSRPPNATGKPLKTQIASISNPAKSMSSNPKITQPLASKPSPSPSTVPSSKPASDASSFFDSFGISDAVTPLHPPPTGILHNSANVITNKGSEDSVKSPVKVNANSRTTPTESINTPPEKNINPKQSTMDWQHIPASIPPKERGISSQNSQKLSSPPIQVQSTPLQPLPSASQNSQGNPVGFAESKIPSPNSVVHALLEENQTFGYSVPEMTSIIHPLTPPQKENSSQEEESSVPGLDSKHSPSLVHQSLSGKESQDNKDDNIVSLINSGPPVIQLDNDHEPHADGIDPFSEAVVSEAVETQETNPFVESTGTAQIHQDSFRVEKSLGMQSHRNVSQALVIQDSAGIPNVDNSFEDVDTAPKAVSFFSFTSPQSTNEMGPPEALPVPPVADMQDLDDLVLGNPIASINRADNAVISTENPSSYSQDSQQGSTSANYNYDHPNNLPVNESVAMASQSKSNTVHHEETDSFAWNETQIPHEQPVDSFAWNEHGYQDGPDPFAWASNNQHINVSEPTTASHMETNNEGYSGWENEFDITASPAQISQSQIRSHDASQIQESQSSHAFQNIEENPSCKPSADTNRSQVAGDIEQISTGASALDSQPLDNGGIQWDTQEWTTHEETHFWDQNSSEQHSIQTSGVDQLQNVESTHMVSESTNGTIFGVQQHVNSSTGAQIINQSDALAQSEPHGGSSDATHGSHYHDYNEIPTGGLQNHPSSVSQFEFNDQYNVSDAFAGEPISHFQQDDPYQYANNETYQTNYPQDTTQEAQPDWNLNQPADSNWYPQSAEQTNGDETQTEIFSHENQGLDSQTYTGTDWIAPDTHSIHQNDQFGNTYSTYDHEPYDATSNVANPVVPFHQENSQQESAPETIFSPPTIDSALPLSEAAKLYSFDQSALKQSLLDASASQNFAQDSIIPEQPSLDATSNYGHFTEPIPEAVTCPSCNKRSDPDCNFCGKCGFNLQTIAKPPVTNSIMTQPFSLENESSSIHQPPNSTQVSSPNQKPSALHLTGSTSAFISQPQNDHSYQYPHHIQGHRPAVDAPQSVRPPTKAPSVFVPPSSSSQPYPNAGSTTKKSVSPIASHIPTSPSKSMPRDPLGRDRGHAITCFGFGGKIVTIFPHRQVVYTTGHNGMPAASEKAYPGTVNIFNVNTTLYPEVKEEIQGWFNGEGPFTKMKNQLKKKAILDHLETQIQKSNASLVPILQLAKFCIETDGNILVSESSGSKTGTKLTGLLDWISQSEGNGFSSSDNSPYAQILSHLKAGDKAGACQIACSYQLWSHALIIATHVSKETYISVVAQFSKSVYPTKDDYNPLVYPELAIIYNLFAGAEKLSLEVLSLASHEEKMKIMEKWKSFISVILANRPVGDLACVFGIGEQLISSGQVCEGQFCFLLASSLACFSAHENPTLSKVVLAASDHYKNPFTYMKDVRALQLTEIFESFSPKKSTGQFLYLIPIKLWYASYLSDLGYLELSYQYLEEIQEVIKASGKNGPFMHLTVEHAAKIMAIWFSSIGTLKANKDKSSKSWLGKFSSNFSGAALGRGLEQLMNNAVGVEESPKLAEQEVSHLSFSPLPAPIIFAEPEQPANLPPPSQPLLDQFHGYSGHLMPEQTGSYVGSDAVYDYGSSTPQYPQYVQHQENVGENVHPQSETIQPEGATQSTYAEQDQPYYGDGNQPTYEGQYAGSYDANGNYQHYQPNDDQQGYYDEYGQYHYYVNETYPETDQNESLQPGYSEGEQNTYEPGATWSNQESFDQATFGQDNRDGEQANWTENNIQENYALQTEPEQNIQEKNYAQPQTDQSQQVVEDQDSHPHTQTDDDQQVSQGQDSYGGWSSLEPQGADANQPHPDPLPSSDQEQNSFFNPLSQNGSFAMPSMVSQVSSREVNASNPPSNFSTPPPVTQPTKVDNSALEDEDLGFGNSSLKKNRQTSSNNDRASKDSDQAVEKKTSEETSTKGSETSLGKDEDKNKNASGSGIFSSIIGSIFGGGSKESKEKGPTTAHLPKGESTFYYDEKLKKWVNKNADSSSEQEKPLAPPPVAAPPSTPAPSTTTSTEPSRQNSPMPPKTTQGVAPLKRSNTTSASGRRGARSRYVDIMNPDANKVDPPAEFVPSFAGLPSMPNNINSGKGSEPKILQPTFVPTQGSIYDQFVSASQQEPGNPMESTSHTQHETTTEHGINQPSQSPAPRTGSAPPTASSQGLYLSKPPLGTTAPHAGMGARKSSQTSVTSSSPSLPSRGLGRPASNPAFGANKGFLNRSPAMGGGASATTVRQGAPPSDL